MWELNHKEGWVPKKWCFWTVVLQKTLLSLLDSKEVKLVNPKGNQPSLLTRRTEAEAPILWPPDVKNRFIGKDPDAGKDWRLEKGTQDEMVGWHHLLSGHDLSKLHEILKGKEAWHALVHGVIEWDTTYQPNNSQSLSCNFLSPYLNVFTV